MAMGGASTGKAVRLQEGGRVLLSEGWLGGVAMAMVARGRPCV